MDDYDDYMKFIQSQPRITPAMMERYRVMVQQQGYEPRHAWKLIYGAQREQISMDYYNASPDGSF